MEPTSDKVWLSLFMSNLSSFVLLHVQHLLFCCNAGLLPVYKSVNSVSSLLTVNLCGRKDHTFLFFSFRYARNSTHCLYTQIFYLLFVPESAEEIPVGSRVCWSELCLYFYDFIFEMLFQPMLLKWNIVNSNTRLRNKTGFHFEHNHPDSLTYVSFIISYAVVCLQFQKDEACVFIHTHIFTTYCPGLISCAPWMGFFPSK